MKLSVLVLQALLMFFVSPAWGGNQWFVKASANFNGDGTAPENATIPGGIGAWKYFSNINWSLVTPGDTINLISGETWFETLDVAKSGTSLNPITITIYGTGAATIDGQNTRKSGIRLNGNSFVTIDGHHGNAVGGDYSYGFRVINLALGEGVVYDISGGHDNKVLHVEGTGTGGSGPDSQGGLVFGGAGCTRIELAYNWIHGPVAAKTDATKRWGISGIIVWTSNTTQPNEYDVNKVHHNKVECLKNDGIKGDYCISMYNNDVSFVWAEGTHADSMLCQSGNYCAIFNNYIHDNEGQNIYLNNIPNAQRGPLRIYNNVIDSPAGFGIVINPLGGSSSVWNDVVIANNTFYRTGGPCIRGDPDGGVTNLLIKNNIFGKTMMYGYQVVKPLSWSFRDADSFDYNVYMLGSSNSPDLVDFNGSKLDLSDLRNLSPARELHGQYASPIFQAPLAGNYNLAPSDTVARIGGTNLIMYFSMDLTGSARPLGPSWSNGAYEANVTRPLPPSNLKVK